MDPETAERSNEMGKVDRERIFTILCRTIKIQFIWRLSRGSFPLTYVVCWPPFPKILAVFNEVAFSAVCPLVYCYDNAAATWSP